MLGQIGAIVRIDSRRLFLPQTSARRRLPMPKVIRVAQSLRSWSGTSSRRHEAIRLAALTALRDSRRACGSSAARPRPGVFHAVLSGDVDVLSARRLTLIAHDFLQSYHACADVDLRGVTSMDSTGLLLLVRLHRTAIVRGGKLTLVEPSGICLRVLESMCFDKIFEIRPYGSGCGS